MQMYYETFKLMINLVTVLSMYNICIIILCLFINKKMQFSFVKNGNNTLKIIYHKSQRLYPTVECRISTQPIC